MFSIHVGSCLDVLRDMESDSVDCIVTSPPYWGLRAYGGNDGMIGMEPTFAEYLSNLVQVFAECKRVLKPTGTLWLNMGDAYSSASKGCGGNNSAKQRSNAGSRFNAGAGFNAGNRIKDKDLIGQPWRLAFALQDQGWYLRSDIIWHKPNPMPESVRDRPTRAHEYIFLLTKSSRYWYDADAIRENLQPSSIARLGQDVESQLGSDRANGGGKTYSGNEWTPRKACPKTGGETNPLHVGQSGQGRGVGEHLEGANARTVWSIATQGYKGAHFATFPEEIPKRCILAGCPVGGTVLDPFAGSGTTLSVALSLGRKAIGIEINPEYARLIEQRLEMTTVGMQFE